MLDFAESVFGDFFNPAKRIFVGYLFLCLLIALAWLVFVRRQGIRHAIARVFDRKVFFSRSSKADYKIFLINRAFSLFISPLLITQLTIATAIYFYLHGQDVVSSKALSAWPESIVIVLFTMTMFIADDFTKYLLHRWMHRYPVLWAVHKVHHSAETLTPVTVYRVHPLEGVLFGLRSACYQGVVIPAFVYLFGATVDLYTILGANVLVFAFHVTGSNLRHSHIDIRYWPWLEYILISPAQHQLHHSIAEEHYDKNFGAALAIWDWLFGSLHLSETDKELTFGLGADQASPDRLLDIYLRPFADIAAVIRRRTKRLSQRLRRTEPRPGTRRA